MSVRIRFKRTGRRNLPSYRIGVFDSRTRRDGPALEILGWFNPLTDEDGKGFRVDAERLHDWLGRGALLSDPVRSLLVRQGVDLGEYATTVRTKGHRRPKKAGAPRTDRQKKRLEAIGRKRKKRASRRAAAEKKAAAKAGA